jgi:hypothetical protein
MGTQEKEARINIINQIAEMRKSPEAVFNNLLIKIKRKKEWLKEA